MAVPHITQNTQLLLDAAKGIWCVQSHQQQDSHAPCHKHLLVSAHWLNRWFMQTSQLLFTNKGKHEVSVSTSSLLCSVFTRTLMGYAHGHPQAGVSLNPSPSLLSSKAPAVSIDSHKR